MKTFDLAAGSRLKVVKATPHKEMHGKDPVQAISLRLEWVPIDNAALNMIAPGLQDALLFDPETELGQHSAEGIPSVKKHRRCPDLAMPVKVPKTEFSGYQLTLAHGIDESTALTLYGVKLSKFEATVSEGGVAVIRWSANSNQQITPELLGELCALEGTEVEVSEFLPPAEPIDGSVKAFNDDHPSLALDGGDEDQDRDEEAGDAFARLAVD